MLGTLPSFLTRARLYRLILKSTRRLNPPATGLARRFLNLIVDDRIPGSKSLRCIDLRRHKLFNTSPAAPRGNTCALNAIRLPSPSLSMRTADSDLKDQRVHFFQATDRRVFCLDQIGRGFLLEPEPDDAPRMVMMPSLHRPKLEPISLYVPCVEPDFDDLYGIGGGNLFIMERRVAKPEPGGGCGGVPFQFEAVVYRKPYVSRFPFKSWRCEPLPPPPPYINGGAGHSWLEISSYTVVGSRICVSVDGDGTYCLANTSDTYSWSWSEVGMWTLPFQGKVHYAPELKLWFGFTAKDQNLAAADLSAMGSHSQPRLLGSWKELEPPDGWKQVHDPQLVSLGSRRFCIARFFRTAPSKTKSGFGDESGYQNVTVLTGVEVGRSHAFGGKVILKMTRHRSLCHNSRCGEDTVTGVF